MSITSEAPESGSVMDGFFSCGLAEADPEPQGELNYVNVYTLLVAVVLSAQATDVGVNKATEKLYKKANTPEAISKLGLTGLKKYIKTIYYQLGIEEF